MGDFDDAEGSRAPEHGPALDEPLVDPSAFAWFGESGTPPGMIGSGQQPLVIGSCGDLPPAPLDDYPWGPAPAELSASDVPIHRDPELTRATAAAVSSSSSWPTREVPEIPEIPEIPAGLADALGEDLEGAGLRTNRGPWIAPATLVAASLGAALWWFTRSEPPPPPPPAPSPVTIAAVPVEPIDPNTLLGSDPNAPRSNAVERISLGDGMFEFVPPPRTTACEDHRAQAQAALGASDWPRLERLARKTECWAHEAEARALRLKALFELERYDECVTVGGRSTNSDVQRWIKRCKTKR